MPRAFLITNRRYQCGVEGSVLGPASGEAPGCKVDKGKVVHGNSEPGTNTVQLSHPKVKTTVHKHSHNKHSPKGQLEHAVHARSPEREEVPGELLPTPGEVPSKRHPFGLQGGESITLSPVKASTPSLSPTKPKSPAHTAYSLSERSFSPTHTICNLFGRLSSPAHVAVNLSGRPSSPAHAAHTVSPNPSSPAYATHNLPTSPSCPAHATHNFSESPLRPAHATYSMSGSPVSPPCNTHTFSQRPLSPGQTTHSLSGSPSRLAPSTHSLSGSPFRPDQASHNMHGSPAHGMSTLPVLSALSCPQPLTSMFGASGWPSFMLRPSELSDLPRSPGSDGDDLRHTLHVGAFWAGAELGIAGPNDEHHPCPDCGKAYSTSSNLARHRQTHRSVHDKKARKCPHCDKVYVSMPAYSMHVRTHSQGCQCAYCGKRFSRPWLLQGHIRTHTGEKPFQCPQCNKAFADKSNLRAHVQTHSADKPYACERCGKAFALKSYLYKHEESSCMRGQRLHRSFTRTH